MNAKILVADDEPAIRVLTQRILAGYEVLHAASGDGALARAREAEPDLILLDVHMPGMGGLEVLDALRSDPRLRLVPVILLTGDGDPEACVRGLDRGADGYLAKPFDPRELAARVGSLLRRSRTDLAASPLTRLPGSPSIAEEVSRRIAAGEPFAFLYADIDRFKAFNDACGYAQGDAIIRETAAILAEAAAAEPGSSAFVGHVGGDDFVVICSPGTAPRIARHAIELFDRAIASLGLPFRAPTLTVCGVTSERREPTHYGTVVRLAAEKKAMLKARAPNGASAFAFDRLAVTNP